MTASSVPGPRRTRERRRTPMDDSLDADVTADFQPPGTGADAWNEGVDANGLEDDAFDEGDGFEEDSYDEDAGEEGDAALEHADEVYLDGAEHDASSFDLGSDHSEALEAWSAFEDE